MREQRPDSNSISTMRCSKCNRSFEISVTTNEAGELETFLQCWHCFSSIRLETRPQPELETTT
ncbi:MAG: hypothetical protein PHI97_28375 [Desulfobulbus sp.]|nr:hypothetical protein [Desulfobulbus sp.]